MANTSQLPVKRVPFRVSAGLKRLIGRDLITDPTVAILELVKNSFDAHATESHLVFLGDRLLVMDNGKGMDRSAILSRWLFVAYSAKTDGTEDKDYEPPAPRGGYRDSVRIRRAYAGSKGVGRFSCDRLGAKLELQSKVRDETVVHVLDINWDEYEKDSKKEFVKIKAKLSSRAEMDLPQGTWPQGLDHGTVLAIYRLRDGQSWTSNELLKLRRALAKLIDPRGSGSKEEFSITVHAPEFIETDREHLGQKDPFAGLGSESEYAKVVNGPVRNFIFETLKEKTTYIEVGAPANAEDIETTLVDRGELIYKIKEPIGKYPLLAEKDVRCELFYLNTAAKQTFARRMGIPSVNFGSVFLFKNGFRIYPIGERNDDTFGISRRKQQGYARQLGTREVIGRIDVTGSDEDFRESTSRDQGLIRTPAYEQLQDFFMAQVLRRLEKYVVDITWKDSREAERSDVSGLTGDKGVERITRLVGRLAGAKNVDVLETSDRLVGILRDRSANVDSHLAAVRLIAEKTGNKRLRSEVTRIENRLKRAIRKEQDALRIADAEVKLRDLAETRARAEEVAKLRATDAYVEEKRRTLFLASLAGTDKVALLDMLHHVGIKSSTLKQRLDNQLRKLSKGRTINRKSWQGYLSSNSMIARQILAISQMGTKANFRLQSDRMIEDLVAYSTQYITEVSSVFSGDGLDIKIETEVDSFPTRFRPIELATVFDNLVSNSRKAKATQIVFRFALGSTGGLVITATDDGGGLAASLLEPERIFELGVSTTSGSGIGLFHVRRAMESMSGTARLADRQPKKGTAFILELPRET